MLARCFIYLLIFLAGVTCRAQTSEPVSVPEQELLRSLRELQEQVKQLRSDLDRTERQAETARAETAEVRGELQAAREQIATASFLKSEDNAKVEPGTSAAAPVEATTDQVDALQQQVGLLEQKIQDQYQTKVEAGAKYRIKLSGLLLVNLFGNRGNVNNIENPTLALAREDFNPVRGSFGGTIRQTQLGLDMFGPSLLRAKTSGTVRLDFAGGFAQTEGGATMGLIRLRTATARLDWEQTSIVMGQDGLFFAPLSPTSFASLEQPPFAYSGNLWGWTPQLRIEHQVELPFARSELTLAGGILDPVSADLPDASARRNPGVGEQSRQPAIATHIKWSRPLFGHKLAVGSGWYRSPQNWSNDVGTTRINSWLRSLDWDVPVTSWASVSGMVYRGVAIGSLGGGLGQTVVFLMVPPALTDQPGVGLPPFVKGLDTAGGWTQLKVTPLRRWEFNAAFGLDNPFAHEIETAASVQTYLEAPLIRNRSILTNVIVRPRSNLILSAEFRHLRSFPVPQQAASNLVVESDSPTSANHINLAVGFLF